MGRHVVIGLVAALLALVGQILFALALDPIQQGIALVFGLTWPPGVELSGTRAQAIGVCLATLVAVAVGVGLGLRERKSPWSDVVATAVWLALFATIISYSTFLTAVFPPEALVERGLVRAVLAADRYLLFLFAVGALLGKTARARTFLQSAGGFGALVVLVGLGATAARFLTYDPAVVAGLAVAFAMVAALLVGFGVAWALRRLAFVELMFVAVFAGYALYLGVALGPSAWTKASSLPEEQIFLALAIFPTVTAGALLTVGASVGFLLNGGGRFDPGFRYEIDVARRYLEARRRDAFVGLVTFFAVAGVCLGVMALIVVLSIMSGFENDLKTKILGAHAHIVVGKHGDDFSEYGDVEGQLRDTRGLDSAAAFLLGDAMVSTDVGLSGTLVKGIEASSEEGTRALRATVTKGEFSYLEHPEEIPGACPRIAFPPPKSPTSTTAKKPGEALELLDPAIREPCKDRRILPGILIGRELSKTLRAYVGDTVKLVSPASEEIGPMGPTPKLKRFRVAGIFYSGMYEYDAKFTYIDMVQAQRFFGMRNRVTGVEVKVRDIDDTSRIVEEIKRRLGGHPYTVKDWRSMNKELFSALLLEKIAMFIALGMIVMVASFLIVAVLVMIVLQRKKEIAILKSLGASDASIMKIFVIQGLILGVGGALLGGTIGVIVCLLVAKFGVDLDPRVFYIERLPVVMAWGEIAAIAVCAVIMSYLATIYPAVTAARHHPVEGLRDD